MTLADTIAASLMAETWVTITEPVLTTKHDQQGELKVGYGWVDSGNEETEYVGLGRDSIAVRTTPFEIFIACATDANNLLYRSNIQTFILGKVVTAGRWVITAFLDGALKNRHDFHCTGKQIVVN